MWAAPGVSMELRAEAQRTPRPADSPAHRARLWHRTSSVSYGAVASGRAHCAQRTVGMYLIRSAEEGPRMPGTQLGAVLAPVRDRASAKAVQGCEQVDRVRRHHPCLRITAMELSRHRHKVVVCGCARSTANNENGNARIRSLRRSACGWNDARATPDRRPDWTAPHPPPDHSERMLLAPGVHWFTSGEVP